jgi:hypothetical protein
VNNKYLEILRKYGMDQRTAGLRECCWNINKNQEVMKKVVNIQFNLIWKHMKIGKNYN